MKQYRASSGGIFCLILRIKTLTGFGRFTAMLEARVHWLLPLRNVEHVGGALSETLFQKLAGIVRQS